MDTTQIRKTGYNEGRSLASQLLISGRREAQAILAALGEESTLVAPISGKGPYVESYTKGFTRRLVERCETVIAHTED